MIISVVVSKCVLEEVSSEIARVYVKATFNGAEKKADCPDYKHSREELPLVVNPGE